jgi:zinc transport system substrate-binding protein
MKFKPFLVVWAVCMAMLPVHTFAKKPISVYVSILPQKYFVERIAGEYAAVQVLVKPGKSPSTYSPSPDQIKHLTTSDIFFRIGVPFENGFLHKIKAISGAIQIVDTRQGIALREMKFHDHGEETDHHETDHHETESHETTHGQAMDDHDPTGKDPHIWMSPLLVKTQARTMAAALILFDPENKTAYEQNLEGFIRDLDDLHDQLAATLGPLHGETIFVFHPVFGYFTDAYGLKQMAIETMGKAPRGKQLSAIIKKAKENKTRVLFVQPEFDQHAAGKIAAAIKGTVVSIDPLAFDYLSNMKTIAQTIGSNLSR